MRNMIRMKGRILLCVIVVMGCAAVLAGAGSLSPACAGEGMWIPTELPDQVVNDMRANGCELTRDQVFNTLGTGVANAVVRVGATGSFVSPDGLILTNHHVAFGAVQRMSTADKNYMTQGFIARSREEEAPAQGYVIYVTQSTDDVTQAVLSAVKAQMSPLERYKAVEGKIKEITKAGEKGRDVFCEVRAFFGGSKYLLYTSIKIKDVRVVYVPSRSIGEYGGDIDNWMWPRHTCDFSFLRAYVAPDGKTAEYSKTNVPYKPKRYLKVSPQGLKEGDFAMTIGFPGRTERFLTSYALENIERSVYPQMIKLDKETVGILERLSKEDPALGVTVAATIKGINNYLKKNEGVLDEFGKFHLVQQEKDRESDLAAALKSDPAAFAKLQGLLGSFKSLYEENSIYTTKDMLIESLLDRSFLLGQAMQLYKWTVEKAKADVDRDPAFEDRRIPDLKRGLRVFQSGYNPRSDREVMKMVLRECVKLPEGQRILAVDEALGLKTGAEPEKAIDAFLDKLYGGTKLGKTEERLRMFDLSRAGILKERDQFVVFAEKLYPESEKRIERRKSFSGSMDVLAPQWIEILGKGSKSPLYADANGTMRVSYGKVEGYNPRDAVYYRPFTTLNGVVEKATGVEPFDCPQKILDLAAAHNYGTYASPDLSDVPANLLTSNDTTGGNSGSPVINSKGEMVGLLFDGNFEALSSDYRFEKELTRTISVDIRYVLFVTDLVDNAQNVIKELGLK